VPVLHMICGKIASGKSTLARRLAAEPATVLIAEDFWTSRLYRDELKTVPDYVRYSARLREAMAPHVEALLKAGVSVVLDFPANTPATRQWARRIFEAAGAGHHLHFLDLPDETCRLRMHRRDAEGTHEFTVTEAEFDEITRYFVAPSAQEGFDMTVHREG
jgi:predicted kinase